MKPPKMVLELIAQRYGFGCAQFNNHPEIFIPVFSPEYPQNLFCHPTEILVSTEQMNEMIRKLDKKYKPIRRKKIYSIKEEKMALADFDTATRKTIEASPGLNQIFWATLAYLKNNNKIKALLNELFPQNVTNLVVDYATGFPYKLSSN